MKIALAFLSLLLLAACGSPPSGGTAPSSTTPQSSVVASPGSSIGPAVSPASLPLKWGTPATPGVTPAPGSVDGWYQEYTALGGHPVPPSTLSQHPPSPADCPSGALCETLPARSSGNFATYWLYRAPEWFAVVGQPPIHPSLKGYSILSFTVKVEAAPNVLFKFDSEAANTCATPAHVRAYIHHSDGTTTRWWSHFPANGPDLMAYLLAPGTPTVSVPLAPPHWVEVEGQYGTTSPATLAGFQQTLADPQYIGLTFGGGCYYSHGVAVSGGSAELMILSYGFH